jgi:hypothetical protein
MRSMDRRQALRGVLTSEAAAYDRAPQWRFNMSSKQVAEGVAAG